MSQDTARLLSAELLAVAESLRKVRSRLVQLIAAGSWPDGTFPDIATVQVQGLDVAAALERLADVPPPKTPSPYDPAERR
jgi:hypothetical protein